MQIPYHSSNAGLHRDARLNPIEKDVKSPTPRLPPLESLALVDIGDFLSFALRESVKVANNRAIGPHGVRA